MITKTTDDVVYMGEYKIEYFFDKEQESNIGDNNLLYGLI